MTEIRLGAMPWVQAGTWAEIEEAAVSIDRLGYDHLWAWDHVYAIFGEPDQSIFEGWTTIAAWAKVTTRTRIGLLVGANTFRNPALVAKMATTVDHISEGRAILGLGGAWFELEHTAHGIDFGRSPGERLKWMDEAAGVVRALLDGDTVNHDGPHYQFTDLHHHPLPIQERLPIMIGGVGERRTLRSVAKYADLWNGAGSLELLTHKLDVLRRHCDEVGRDIAEIELTVNCKPIIRDTEAEAQRVLATQLERNRTPASWIDGDATFWSGTPEQIAETMVGFTDAGFNSFIGEMAAPYDAETLERWITEVKPMVESA